MFRLFVHQGIVCKDMKLLRTYIFDRDQLPNVIFLNFIPSFEFISWRGINTSQNERSLNQFVFSHTWPTKYTAIYVPEKAIKQEGQFLYLNLS